MSHLRLQTGILLYMISYISALAVNNSIRLYGGSSKNNTEGVVQVFVDDEWKAICNGGWDAVDALVTCRQLGFTDGYALIWTDPNPSGWHPIRYHDVTVLPEDPFPVEWDDFKCNGDEESLLSCKYTKYTGKHCSTVAGVACGISKVKYNEFVAYFNGWDYSNRISYTVNGLSGGLVLSNSDVQSWKLNNIQFGGGVCDMDDRAAMLICKWHGYFNGGKKIKVPAIEGMPMVISKVICTDQCNSLNMLKNSPLTSTGVCPDGIQYNGVKCYTTVAPSIIGALVFAGVASILIIIAGACGIHWIKKDPKIQHVTLSPSESEADEDTSSLSQSDI